MPLTARTHRFIDSLPWVVSGKIRNFLPAPYEMYCVLSSRPLVILIPEDWTENRPLWTVLFEDLRSERVHFLLLVRGPIELNPPAYWHGLQEILDKHHRRYPRHNFVYLANNQAQKRLFGDANIPYALINQNCLINDQSYNSNSTAPKKFDALYNAVMLPYKRHVLASEVSSLALVTYLKDGSIDYFRETARLLAHAVWLNYPEGNPSAGPYHRLTPLQVAEQIRRSRVGLALSAQEGAMFAATEYLLCGVPVVTTPSVGGREAMFPEDCVVETADDAAAVAVGVREMIGRNLDPDYVRQQTLSLMRPHRDSMVRLIQELGRGDGINVVQEEVQERIFPGTIYKMRPLHRAVSMPPRGGNESLSVT